MRRAWRNSLIGTVVAIALTLLALYLLNFEPDPLRVALLVALVAAVSRLVSDTFRAEASESAIWATAVDEPVRPVGEDARLAMLVRILTQHQVARSPDGQLLDRIAELADRRLEQRHGVRRAADPERAAELLGPELSRALTEKRGHRLGLTEIDQHLRRIEEL